MKTTFSRLAVTICLNLCWVFIVVADVGAQDPPVVKPSILDDYRKAIFDVETHYSKIQVKGAYFHVLHLPETADLNFATASFELARNGERFKFALTDYVARNRQGRVRSKLTSLSCSTPEEYFTFLKDAGTGSYRLADHHKPPDRSAWQRSHTDLEGSFEFPFTIQLKPIRTLLNSDAYVLTSESAVEVDGRSLVKLRFELKPEFEANSKAKPGNLLWYSYYSLLVSPKEHYVLHGYVAAQVSARSASPFLKSGRIEYLGTQEGFPVPKRVTYFGLDPLHPVQKVTLGDGSEAKGQVRHTGTYVYDPFQFATLPEDSFALSAVKHLLPPATSRIETRPKP